MPCDTVTTVQVEWGKGTDLNLLTAALQSLALHPYTQDQVVYFGNGEYINTSRGQTRLSANRNINEIKQAYSSEVVKCQAKKYGWQLQQLGPHQYAINKR